MKKDYSHNALSSHNVGFNKKYTTIALYALITLFIAAVFIFFLINGDQYTTVFDFITGIFTPIFLGMLIAYLLNPFMSFFENRIFISKKQRALYQARKKLLYTKLQLDSVRKNARSSQEAIENVQSDLSEARNALAAAKEAVQLELSVKEAKRRGKRFQKKVRLTFRPNPPKDRSHPMRGVSILCTYLLFFSVISLVLWIVIPQCIDSLLSLVRNLESYFRALPAQLQNLVNRNETIRRLYETVNSRIDLNDWIADFAASASKMLSGLLASLPDFIISVISTLASGITNLILSIFLSIYFLASKEILSAQLQRFCRAFLPRRAFYYLRHVVVEIDHKFGKFIAGKILDSTLIGMLALIAMMIMGIPYYQMLALVIGITNIIPFFGPFIGAFIGGLIILISEPAKLIPFVIMVLILQQLEGNVIEPQVLGDSLGLSPVWIMIAIVIMSGLFGIFGMIFGVPIFAVIYTLLHEAIERRLKQQKTLPSPPSNTTQTENLNESPPS